MGIKRTKKQTSKTSPSTPKRKAEHNPQVSFMEHLLELRRRLFYMALSIILWSAAAYFVQQQIVHLLLKPASHQQFIYTSVGGGIDFLFRVCLYTGVVFSIPVIVYQVLKYTQPLIKEGALRFIAFGSIMSGVLAMAGMVFGYYVGLPAALHFLLHQFTTDQIHPLLTIQSYMSFVTLYMLGSALLFQLPLILILINRIKPLKPKKMFRYERWVILLAFVGGGIMNPSPRVQDQLMLAGPVILAYQVGILLVWLSNRRSGPTRTRETLREKDERLRAERLQKFQAAQEALQQKRAAIAPAAAMAPAAAAIAPIQTIAVPVANAAGTAARAVAAPRPLAAPAAHPVRHAGTMDVRRAARPQTQSRPQRTSPALLPRQRYFNDFSPRRTPETGSA